MLMALGLACTVASSLSVSAQGWTKLFNGKNLDGWAQRGGKAGYRVQDGTIVGTTVTNTGNSFLCTQRDYTNFVLEVEFKIPPGMNSGVQIRSHCFTNATEVQGPERIHKIPAGRVHGLQVEIDSSPRAWTAGIYEEGVRGWLKDLKSNEPARRAFKAQDWNHLRVECRGDSIRTWINGISAAELKDDRCLSGFIALQVHAVGKNGTAGREVAFRNLRIQEL